MANRRFADDQIKKILQQSEEGVPVSELCLKHGMCKSSFYKWRIRYAEEDFPLKERLEILEGENMRLKRMYAEASLKIEELQEALLKGV